MILDHDALEALRSKIATLGITSLSDDDPTETEYMWALVQDLTEARAELATAREKALEEAAERIGSYAAAASADDNTQARQAFEAAESAIRALATKGKVWG